MSETRPYTKCYRGKGTAALCGRRYDEHAGGQCPDGRGTFRKQAQSSTRASASFSEDEIALLEEIRRGLVKRGQDLSHLSRHEAFPSLVQKIATMRAAVERATKPAPSTGAAPASPGGSSVHTHPLNGAGTSTARS